MSSSFPRPELPPVVDERIADWVASVLARDGASIDRPTIEPDAAASARGATGRIFRVRGAEQAGTIAYLKVAPGGTDWLRSRREALVLARLGSALGVRVPKLIGAHHPGPHEPVLILLEPIPGRAGDLVRGATSNEVERTIDAIAALHARWWAGGAHGTLPADLLPRWGAGTAEAARPHERRAARFRRLLPRFLAHHETPAETRMHLDALGDRLEAVLADAAAPPATLLHGDLHLENLVFPEDAGPPCMLDWQSASIGPPAYDVVLFLASAVESVPLVDVFPALVARHHAALRAGLPDAARGPSLDEHLRTARTMADVVLAGLVSGYGNRSADSLTTAERAALARSLAPRGLVAVSTRPA